MGRTGLAVALAVTAAVAGCGDSDSSDEPSGSAQGVSGEEQRVAQVIEDFEQAAKDGDNARICDEIFAERDRPENCEADVGSFLQATEIERWISSSRGSRSTAPRPRLGSR
jgi:hypothetical protein